MERRNFLQGLFGGIAAAGAGVIVKSEAITKEGRKETMRRISVMLSVCLLLARVAAANPVNLIANGDFSMGNYGFTSDYIYQPSTLNALWNPGTYGVDSGADVVHSLWETSGDHTDGSGDFMLINGYTGQPNRTVWSQSVMIEPSTNYFFEAWAKNLCCTDYAGPVADLSFWINGILIGTGGIDGPGVWHGVSTLWYSAADTLARLEIKNSSVDYGGNDFGLDDIYLGRETSLDPVPEPASFLLLGAGLIYAARRTRRLASRT